MMLGWFKIVGLVLLAGVLLSGTSLVALGEENNEEDPQGDFVFIVGTASKVKFLGDVSPIQESEKESEKEIVYFGQLFEVKFDQFKVYNGIVEKKKLRLELIANHAESFTRPGGVFVLLDVSDQDNPKPMWWGPVFPAACFEKGFIKSMKQKYGDIEIEDYVKGLHAEQYYNCKILYGK